MYADDVIIMSENPAALQNSLNNLQKYCNKWALKVNTKKTKVMVFNSRQCKHTFVIGNEIINNVDRVCYLGLC